MFFPRRFSFETLLTEAQFTWLYSLGRLPLSYGALTQFKDPLTPNPWTFFLTSPKANCFCFSKYLELSYSFIMYDPSISGQQLTNLYDVTLLHFYSC